MLEDLGFRDDDGDYDAIFNELVVFWNRWFRVLDRFENVLSAAEGANKKVGGGCGLMTFA